MRAHSQSITFELENVTLDRMAKQEVEEAASFISHTMNPDEGGFALRTMRFHFQCRQQALDDGRDYYAWHANGKIAGLVGLHHYVWGPDENVWLGWFALDRAYRRNGIGRRLISEISAIALEKGYSKLYVETYSSATFADARAFYEATGFSETGRIANYMPDGAAMVVYSKPIGTIEKKTTH